MPAIVFSWPHDSKFDSNLWQEAPSCLARPPYCCFSKAKRALVLAATAAAEALLSLDSSSARAAGAYVVSLSRVLLGCSRLGVCRPLCLGVYSVFRRWPAAAVQQCMRASWRVTTGKTSSTSRVRKFESSAPCVVWVGASLQYSALVNSVTTFKASQRQMGCLLCPQRCRRQGQGQHKQWSIHPKISSTNSD